MGRPIERHAETRPNGLTGQGPVPRSFHLLQLVVASDAPLGVRELARRSGLARSSVSRHLAVLAELGMVSRTPNGESLPGPALASLVRGGSSGGEVLAQRLRPLLIEMAEEFGENSAFGVDRGDRFFYLEGERQTGVVQVPDPTSTSYPAHLLASGLLMMAHWDEERIANYLAGELEAATDNSVIEPDLVRRRLDRVREQGYCWALEELDLEVNGLAVPVWGDGAKWVGAVSLYGPSYRMNPKDRPDLAARLVELVASRAAHLNHHP